MNGFMSMMRLHDKLENILDCVARPFQIQQNRTFNIIYLYFCYVGKFQHFSYIYVKFYSIGPEQIDELSLAKAVKVYSLLTLC